MPRFLRTSRYQRIKGCDCPDCAPAGILTWLAQPAGGWLTVLGFVIGVLILLAACGYGWSQSDALLPGRLP